jgi:hypothetical protein
MAVSEVALSAVMDDAVWPAKLTDVAPPKLVPVTVTAVPPTPDEGLTAVTAGGGGGDPAVIETFSTA